MVRLSCKMSERMDTLSNEMELIWVPLAIDQLEIEDPLEKELMHSSQLFPRDCPLVDDPNCSDKPTEVGVVGIQQNSIEDTRSQAVDIVEELPGLIPARDLLLWISRWTAKGSRQKLCSI